MSLRCGDPSRLAVPNAHSTASIDGELRLAKTLPQLAVLEAGADHTCARPPISAPLTAHFHMQQSRHRGKSSGQPCGALRRGLIPLLYSSRLQEPSTPIKQLQSISQSLALASSLLAMAAVMRPAHALAGRGHGMHHRKSILSAVVHMLTSFTGSHRSPGNRSSRTSRHGDRHWHCNSLCHRYVTRRSGFGDNSRPCCVW